MEKCNVDSKYSDVIQEILIRIQTNSNKDNEIQLKMDYFTQNVFLLCVFMLIRVTPHVEHSKSVT